MRKFAIAFLLAGAALFSGCASVAFAQAADNTLYVKQFPGKDVGTKVGNAVKSCGANSAVPCIIVIDPSLGAFSTGVMPALCSNCYLEDLRNGPPVSTQVGGFLSAVDGHGGSDWGYATQFAISTLAAQGRPCSLSYPFGKDLPWYSTVYMTSGKCSFYFNGSSPIPQAGGNNGTWNLNPWDVTMTATLTEGSRNITYSSTAGVAADMRIGGYGVRNSNYLLSATSTAATMALKADMFFVALPTNGSATVCGVNRFKGLATGQAFTLPTTGAQQDWKWGTGGASATILSLDPVARCVTFSDTITVAVTNSLANPVAFTAATGTTWSVPVYLHKHAPMIVFENEGQNFVDPNFEGYTVRSGIYDAHFKDPAYNVWNANHTSVGRTVYGVDVIQVVGNDNLFMQHVRVDQIPGAAFIFGGDDNNGAYCPNGSPREQANMDLQAADSGDWRLGAGNVEIFTPYCSDLSTEDAPNQLGFYSLKIMSPWGPGIVAGSYNLNATTWPRQIRIFDGQLEGGSRTGGDQFAASAILLDLQLVDDLVFDGQFAVGGAQFPMTSYGTVNSMTFKAGTSFHLGEHEKQYTVNVGSGSVLTYVSGSQINGFESTGMLDDTCGFVFEGATSYKWCAAKYGAATATTLTPAGDFSIPVASNATLYMGLGGYPNVIHGTLGSYVDDVPYISSDGADQITLNLLDPGTTANQSQNVFISGSFPQNMKTDYLGYHGTSYGTYARIDYCWTMGTSCTKVFEVPNLATGGNAVNALAGIDDSSGNGLYSWFHNTAGKGSANNYGAFGTSPGNAIFKLFPDGTVDFTSATAVKLTHTYAVRAGTWSIASSTSTPVTFATAFGTTPTSCSVTPTGSAAATGLPYYTSLTVNGMTVNVPTSGNLNGTYQCLVTNAN